jgi:hypothetical protein
VNHSQSAGRLAHLAEADAPRPGRRTHLPLDPAATSQANAIVFVKETWITLWPGAPLGLSR